MDVLIHLGICLVFPIATGLVVFDLLLDRRNAGLLGNLNSAAAHDSENRGSTSLLFAGMAIRSADRVNVRQEEIVARVIK